MYGCAPLREHTSCVRAREENSAQTSKAHYE
jgi:hypothetical protein